MAEHNPLSSLFFRYRRRKHSSVDGFTQGLEYSHAPRRSTAPSNTGHAAQINRDEYDALNAAKQYQPGRPFYLVQGPEYERPAPWHEATFDRTPPLRFESRPRPVSPVNPEIDHELDAGLLRGFENEATDAGHCGATPVPRATGIEHLFDPDRTVRLTIGEIHRHMAAQRAYAESVMAGDFIDALADGYVAGPSAEDVFSSALTEAAAKLEEAAEAMNALELDSAEFGDSAPHPDVDELGASEPAFAEPIGPTDGLFAEAREAESLDDLVEQEWQQLDPFAMHDPMQMMDEYGQFPPGPPGMPMDPFGPMM